MRTQLFAILSLVAFAGLLTAQPAIGTPEPGQAPSSIWGTNVQVTYRQVYDFDVDYRANGEMWLACINGLAQHDTLFVYSSTDGGINWIPQVYFTMTGDARRFTDVNIVCGDTLFYVFMPADTAAGLYRDYLFRRKYDGAAYSWQHFAAGTATGIIDDLDADRSGLPGDTMNVFYHTDNDQVSLANSWNEGVTWASANTMSGCSSPSITWVNGNQWAAAYRSGGDRYTSLAACWNSGSYWYGGPVVDTTQNDTANAVPWVAACHGTGQLFIATVWNSGDATWGKEIRVYCATDGGNTEFVNAFTYQFAGDQGMPVVNCLRFGGNDWGNVAYCDWGYSADSVRYAYNFQGGTFNYPEVVSDRPGSSGAQPHRPRIAYCDDGGHPGPAIFYVGPNSQGIYMNAEWLTGVAGGPGASAARPGLRLQPNRPNPMRQWTEIDYQLPSAGKVSLNVYNIAGQLVRTLVDGAQPAGSHAARWDGRDDRGREVSSGIYLYRLATGAGTAARRMTVLR